MRNYDIAIIGGGPAGMMAAISASKNSSSVILLEKNSSLGCKLLLTGGGRCNITNLKPIKELLDEFDNKNFLKHSFYTLTNEKLLSFFDIEFICEDNDRVFPKDFGSQKILELLTYNLEDVDIRYNFEVISISDDFVINNEIKADKIIITTGGITYPQTGSSKSNYALTSQPITDIKYGLAPLITKKDLSSIAGVVLNDVVISYNKKVRSDVLFSHTGITGPGIMDISNEISKSINYNLLVDDVEFSKLITIDLTPDLSQRNLLDIFTSDFNSKTLIKNYLKQFLPKSFIVFFLDECGIKNDLQLSGISKKNKNKLIEYLKNYPLEVIGFNGDLSKITIGGVDVKHINSKTMESKLISNLYFAGEILDVTAPTGGYNLKLAFSTGYLAGLSASKK